MECVEKMKIEKLRQKAIELSHTPDSSDLARQYFKSLGLRIESINLNQCKVLSEYIQKEIDILLKDKSYQMINKLRMNHKIDCNKSGLTR